MKIKHVEILNLKPPGDSWWKNVEKHPTEPLIEATFDLTLSWEEYKVLLDSETKDDENNNC